MSQTPPDEPLPRSNGLSEREIEAAIAATGHKLSRAVMLFEPYDDIFTWLIQQCEHCDDLVVLYGQDAILIARRATSGSLGRLLG